MDSERRSARHNILASGRSICEAVPGCHAPAGHLPAVLPLPARHPGRRRGGHLTSRRLTAVPPQIHLMATMSGNLRARRRGGRAYPDWSVDRMTWGSSGLMSAVVAAVMLTGCTMTVSGQAKPLSVRLC